jgi:hypothetical protein
MVFGSSYRWREACTQSDKSADYCGVSRCEQGAQLGVRESLNTLPHSFLVSPYFLPNLRSYLGLRSSILAPVSGPQVPGTTSGTSQLACRLVSSLLRRCLPRIGPHLSHILTNQ